MWTLTLFILKQLIGQLFWGEHLIYYFFSSHVTSPSTYACLSLWEQFQQRNIYAKIVSSQKLSQGTRHIYSQQISTRLWIFRLCLLTITECHVLMSLLFWWAHYSRLFLAAAFSHPCETSTAYLIIILESNFSWLLWTKARNPECCHSH